MTTGQIIRISQDLTPAKIWESMGLYYSQNKMPRQKLTPSKIWASMGLCYSHNTNKYGKKNYPYKEVLPLALLLWKYHLPQVNTIVRMVHTEPKLTEEMKKYKAMLERAGAVVEWIPAGNLSCVTKSQLVRSLELIQYNNNQTVE